MWTVTVIATFAALLTGAPPAMAAQPFQPWDPQPQAPEFTMPGTGEKVLPFTGMESTEPRALQGFTADSGGSLLRRPRAAEPEPPPRICRTLITKTVAVREVPPGPGEPPPSLQYSRIDYRAEVFCTFTFNFAFGVAGLVDRTSGFDERRLHYGNQFSVAYGNYAVSSGVLEIPGEQYDGGRQLEVIFDVTVNAEGIWGACAPGPGARLLRCDGLSTSTLRIVEGSYAFGSGLRPAVIRYVALGDSFSGGTGAGNYMADSTDCRRSRSSYPFLLRGMRAPLAGGPSIDEPVMKACDGAKTVDIFATQVFQNAEQAQRLWINRNATRLVTLSIGGNDLGFATKLYDCIFAECTGPMVTQLELDSTQRALTGLYLNLLGRMRPDARLVVIGYPAILPSPRDPFERRDCGATSGYSDAELVAFDDAWLAVRAMVNRAVAAVPDPRIRFVDMYDAFWGHKVCSDNPWVNGRELDTRRSYHPNAEGYPAYRDRIAQTLGLA